MRSRPKALGWTSLVTLLAALHVAPAAEAASAARQCRRACRDKIGVCIGVGGRPRVCRKNVLGRCKQAGVGVCQNPAGSPGISPGQVFQQTPAVSGTATIQTCGDVNGDGIVNIGDALVVAEFDVAIRPCSQLIHPEACDVNGDGACNIDDALRIAQCDVGLISCAFTCGPFRCPSTTSTTTTTTRPPTTTTTTLVGSGGFLSGILTDPTLVLTEPNLPKPTYLVPVVPSPFGVPCTRSGNNVGLSTSPVGGTWGSDARHVYSKQEPWSADESLISIENSGGPSPLILDGFTYLPKYAPCSNYDLWDYRWHPSRTHAHEQINVDSSGTHLSWFDVASCTETRSWSLPIPADYGIGSGEGNPSNDGRFVLIQGTRQIYVVDMDPQPPFAPYPSQRIGPALDVSNCGIGNCSIDWAGMSASGKYAIVSYNGDNPRVFDVNASTLALTPHAMSTSSFRCQGTAAGGYVYSLGHADVAVNPFDNNEDVLVGQDECLITGQTVNGVLISHVMMARLRDGQITALTDL